MGDVPDDVKISATFVTEDSYAFRTPSNILISAATQCGKSVFLRDILLHKNGLFLNAPNKCVFYYKVWQTIYDDIRQHFEGKVVFLNIFKAKSIEKLEHCFVVFDDFLSDLNKEFLDIFLVSSHQKKLTVIFLSQSLYYDNMLKIIRRNSHYYIFLSQLDASSVYRLMANDITGKALSKFRYAFEYIMNETLYTHIIYDRNPATKTSLRMKYDILSYQKNKSLNYIYKVFDVYD